MTPPSAGPWTYEWANGRICIDSEETGQIAIIEPWLSSDREEANAKLICAAPTMLATLQAIEVVLKGNKLANVGNSTIHYALMQARNAIAAATGDQP